MDRGPWIQTFGGKKFHLFDPSPDEVRLEDIAHALANECRFAGHTNPHYSVAQHSVIVSRQLPKRPRRILRLQALLHDAHEYALKDMLPWVKALIPHYGAIVLRVNDAIFEALDVPPPNGDAHDRIKAVDLSARETEKRDLFHDLIPEPGYEHIELFEEKVVALPAGKACNLFLERFHELKTGRII